MNPVPGDTANQSGGTNAVGVVVLNYNGKDVLTGLLKSLEKVDYPDFRIFFVDNASTDGSVEIARSFSDRLPMEIIENEKNLLFSAGNNVGIKRALDWQANFIFLLNNDTIVPSSLLTELVDFMEKNRDAGITGPMIHFGEPAGTIWGAGGKVMTWWGLVRHRGIRETDDGQFSKPEKVNYVSGAAMMIRREVIDKIGLLDTNFPMYFEDTDYCFRARQEGHEVWFVPTSPVIHLVSVAAGGQASSFKIRRRFSAGLKFFARHARWYQWPTIILGQVYEALRVGLMIVGGMK